MVCAFVGRLVGVLHGVLITFGVHLVIDVAKLSVELLWTYLLVSNRVIFVVLFYTKVPNSFWFVLGIFVCMLIYRLVTFVRSLLLLLVYAV